MRELVSNPAKRLFIDFGAMTTQEKVEFWCSVFPHDVWFRRKYGIMFLSDKHKKLSLSAMKFEYLEDRYLKHISKIAQEEAQNPTDDEQTTQIIEEFSNMAYDDIINMVNQ